MARLYDDLLRGQNSQFTVSFDMPTPRAHFVLLQRKDRQGQVSDYNQLTMVQKEAMLHAARAMVSEYRLTPTGVTFSLHRGSWYNSHHFHAHLCTDVDEYLQIFRNVCAETQNWPSAKDVNRQWKASRNPMDYEKNVRGYPYRNYFNEESREIQCEVDKSSDRSGVSGWTDVLGSGLLDSSFVPHSSKPWMGVMNPTASSVGFIDHMEAIAAKVGLSGPRVQNGCHLCYFLDEAMGRRLFPPAQKVPAGYIKMTPLTFMKILQPSQRKTWLGNFKASTDHNVMT